VLVTASLHAAANTARDRAALCRLSAGPRMNMFDLSKLVMSSIPVRTL
jgi:hypothetical protein